MPVLKKLIWPQGNQYGCKKLIWRQQWAIGRKERKSEELPGKFNKTLDRLFLN
jgi:hypothetical protein